MAEMTEAEWQNLYENFETTWLTAAVENIDTLRGLLADRENGEPPGIRDDLLKLPDFSVPSSQLGAMRVSAPYPVKSICSQ